MMEVASNDKKLRNEEEEWLVGSRESKKITNNISPETKATDVSILESPLFQ
jgi:hypothetical protein